MTILYHESMNVMRVGRLSYPMPFSFTSSFNREMLELGWLASVPSFLYSSMYFQLFPDTKSAMAIFSMQQMREYG